MKNVKDYDAGLTTGCLNPATGRMCYGGAARNLRTFQAGGLASIKEDERAVGVIIGLELAKPMLAQYQNQLAQATIALQHALQQHELQQLLARIPIVAQSSSTKFE